MRDNSKITSTPALDENIQSHIGRRLRSLFDAVAQEPVPERFLDLLDQLEQASVINPPAPGNGRARASEGYEPASQAGMSK